MAKPPPYLEEIPIKLAYKSKEYPQRARGFSFFVCVCSIFVYISVFYAFNLSPSTFLNNKFWFFISNTLILIIAADYGAFSSSGGYKHDVYEEYVMNSQARSYVSSFVSQYPGIVKKSISKEEVEDLSEIKKEVIVAQKQKHPENKLEIVTHREPGNPNQNFHEKKTDMESAKKDVTEARTYRRSKSDKPKRVVIDESKNNILRRSESEKEESVASVEENEFSAMSNEELNRRVEEFIQRFNRQIRLQRAGRFHEI